MHSKKLSPQDEQAIRTVVECQLKAFQNNDATTAFSLTCLELQRQFRQPQEFMEMIKNHYQPIYSPRAVIFEGFFYTQQRPTLQMMLMTQRGNLIRALYMMQHQSNLSWRITGYQLLPFNIDSRHRHQSQD